MRQGGPKGKVPKLRATLALLKVDLMSWSDASSSIRSLSRAVNSLGHMALGKRGGMFSQLRGAKKLHTPRQIRMAIRSPAKLRGFLLDNLDRFDVISFDVFDTLLERRIHPPEVVKEHSAAFLSKLLLSFSISLQSTDILARRCAIEMQLRRLATEEGFDAEFTFIVLAEKLVAACTGTTLSAHLQKQIVETFVQNELELEQQVLAPHAEMSSLFRELLHKDKRVILSSDMYLSADQIRGLLCINGLPAHDVPLYVSSELKVSKGTGRLFRYWMESEHVTAERAIHIGDNAVSDFSAALAAGLNAIYFADSASQRRRQKLLSLRERAAGNDYWKGAYILAVSEQFKSRPPQDDLLYRYGRQFLGPVFAVSIHRLIEQVGEYGIQQLLFLAREGFILKKIYDLFEHSLIPHGKRPDSEYAYLTRYSTALASVSHFSPREIEMGACKLHHWGGLAQVLNAYGLPQEPFATIAAEYGISLNDPINKVDEPRLIKFLTDSRTQSAIAPLQRSAAAKLNTYLGQCGFWGRNRKVGLVDVGWEGTIQFNLLNAFGQRQDFPQLFGFYLGRRKGRNLLNYSPSYAEGLLYDYRNYSIRERLPLEFIQIFEQAVRAPHGTTLGYRCDERNDAVHPIFKQPGQPDRNCEILNNPYIAVIQQGIFDFAERYLEAIRWTGYNAEQIKPFVLATAARFVCMPRKDEAQKILGLLKHSEDFGASTVLELGVREFNPLRLGDWKKLRHTLWKQGTLAQNDRALAWLATAFHLSFFSSW
jgi:predicted HAD superfamily hydrolase